MGTNAKIPMSQYVDNLLKTGGTVIEITEKMQSEAQRRKVKWGTQKQHLFAHIAYRTKYQKWEVTVNEGVITTLCSYS